MRELLLYGYLALNTVNTKKKEEPTTPSNCNLVGTLFKAAVAWFSHTETKTEPVAAVPDQPVAAATDSTAAATATGGCNGRSDGAAAAAKSAAGAMMTSVS